MGLGATSIGVGALYGTGAFSSVNAGRGISVNAANDSDALLGIEGKSADTTPKFTNRTGIDMPSVELDSDDDIEFDVTGDGEFEEPPVSFSIESGDSQEVELGGTDEEADVSITADLADTDGEPRGEISLSRVFEIPQTAAIRDVEGSATGTGGSGKYSFELQNTQPEDGRTATIVAIRVDDTDSDAVQVGGNNDDILTAEGTQIVDEVLDIDSQNEEDIGRTDFIEGEELELEPNGEDGDLGNEIDLEFDRFRTGDGGGTQVTPDDVDITVWAEDGSSASIELRLE